jgi:CRP-like cAMP-binding protein
MQTSSRNRLLDALSPGCREEVLALSKEVELPVRTQLYWPEEMPQYGYFLTSGIASIVAGLNDGGTAEVGLIGNEGLIGAFHLLGPLPPMTECFIQVPGSGYRIPLPALRRVFLEREEFRGRILEFVQQQSMVVSQVAACNKLHEAEPRLARWLLMIMDRTNNNHASTNHNGAMNNHGSMNNHGAANRHGSVKITQEFVAQMIGTRRTTVNGILGQMQKAGLLDHQRGQIIVPDRLRLEGVACDCYPLILRSLDRLYT